MKRNLIGLVAVALGLVANAALADNNYTFDDAYWKQAEIVVSVQPMQATESRGKYSDVDDYNP
jgi:hypothetical protein